MAHLAKSFASKCATKVGHLQELGSSFWWLSSKGYYGVGRVSTTFGEQPTHETLELAINVLSPQLSQMFISKLGEPMYNRGFICTSMVWQYAIIQGIEATCLSKRTGSRYTNNMVKGGGVHGKRNIVVEA